MTPELFKGRIFFDKTSNKWAYCRYNRGYTTTYYCHQSTAENDALRDIRDDIVTEVDVYTKVGYHKKSLGHWSIRKSYPATPVQDTELVALVRKQDSTIQDLKITAQAWEKVAEELYVKAKKYDQIMEVVT